MEEGIITEQNYPIEGKWIFKSILGSSIGVVIFFSFLLFSETNGELLFYLAYFAIFFTFNVFYAILSRSNFHYQIDAKFLNIRQGILRKQEKHIPYGVIQNVFVKQDLFDRLFGLASLALENASMGAGVHQAGQTKVFGMTLNNRKRSQIEAVGFSGNRVSIPGLTKQNAETLKNIVLQKMKENPIEDSQSGL